MLKPAREYGSLEAVKNALSGLGGQIQAEGLPEEIAPLVCAFTGRGHVSKGAQKMFNLLPVVEIHPDDLPTLASSGSYSKHAVYRVEFRKRDLYEPFESDAMFDAAEFDEKPGSFKGKFHRYAPFISVLVNGVFWSSRYPRILTRDHLSELYSPGTKPRLKVIADITCDIEGSIESTVRSTTHDNPVYVFEPGTGRDLDGFSGQGPVVMAVDTLSAALPREASESFGAALLSHIPALAAADYTVAFEDLDLPERFKRAVIAHRGNLTDKFRYLNEHVLRG
jgi:alpha-aminoadipic semialdehyde synthase